MSREFKGVIPDRTIEVPEALGELFEVIEPILDVDTPVRKTTECSQGHNYPTLHTMEGSGGLSTELRISRLPRVDKAHQYHPFSYPIKKTVAASAYLKTNGQMSSSAAVIFGQEHLLEQPYKTSTKPVIDAWFVGIRHFDGSDTIKPSEMLVASNGLLKVIDTQGRLMARPDQPGEGFDEYLGALVGLAQEAGKALLPEMVHDKLGK